MKHAPFTKALCLSFALILLGSVIPAFPLALPAAAKGMDYTAEAVYPPSPADVTICGDANGNRPSSDMDVIAMQFVTTADALMVSTNVPSYSNNTGSVTAALFAFDTDYDTSLLASPMAEHTFVDFRDGALYHCGPVCVPDGASGWRVVSAGPTTSVRENPYEPAFIRASGRQI